MRVSRKVRAGKTGGVSRARRVKALVTVASIVGAASRPGAPSWPERAQAVPRLVRATIDGTYGGTTRGRLALVAAAVAYVVSPVDLLPEVLLPVLGAADDAVVISWVLRVFVEETDRFLAWELGQGVHDLRDGALTSRGGGPSWPARPAGVAGAARPVRDAARIVGGGGARPGGLRDEVRSAATNYVLESVRRRLER